MRYYTCKCGAYECWGSGVYIPCTVCTKCGTNPDTKGPPLPHKYSIEQVEADDGVHPLSRCVWCMKTKKQLEN